MLTGYIEAFGYAARLESGEVQKTHFYLAKDQPHPHFTYLGLNAEEMFVTRRAFLSCRAHVVDHRRVGGSD